MKISNDKLEELKEKSVKWDIYCCAESSGLVEIIYNHKKIIAILERENKQLKIDKEMSRTVIRDLIEKMPKGALYYPPMGDES
tara:strand:+ start:376 stop:624 length:249 start_codon:yes stop_codon:yes gene_type:complete